MVEKGRETVATIECLEGVCRDTSNVKQEKNIMKQKKELARISQTRLLFRTPDEEGGGGTMIRLRRVETSMATNERQIG